MEVLAPGKLFLIGEYAVLDGGDAIVAAVNHGVRCEVEVGHGVQTPDGDSRFVDAALAAVSAPVRSYRFSVWNPLPTQHKVGLGGSAAACVAAIAAARMACGETLRQADLALAMQVHLEVQGSGSGRDVMASYYGGLSHFQGRSRRALDPLPITVVHSGQPASTGPRVEAYKAISNRADFLQEAKSLVDSFQDAPVQSLHDYGRLLQDMAIRAGFTYSTDAHARISELATAHGGSAKPSGAGGGDIAVALIPEEDARAAFVAACAQQGLAEIPLKISPGLHSEPSNA